MRFNFKRTAVCVMRFKRMVDRAMRIYAHGSSPPHLFDMPPLSRHTRPRHIRRTHNAD